MKEIKGFEHFLEIDEENVSKNIEILDKDFQLILDLDNIYSTCLNITLPADSNIVIPAFLYLISHQEFYNGMASFLRLHKSQSFRCLRAALDSSFTAYYLLKNPDNTQIYINKSRNATTWESLFRNIKVTMKNNQKKFPLAVGLPYVHDLCSKYAHADPDGILHKYFIDKEKKKLNVRYFDYERSHDEYRKWFAFLLFYFYKIFLIYWHEMLKNSAGRMKKDIEYLIKAYKIRITQIKKQYAFS